MSGPADGVLARGPEDRARIRPTTEFWRTLWFPGVFSVGALLLRQDLVFLLGALVVGCGCAAYPLCLRNLAGVRVRRLIGPRARVGVDAPCRLRIENRGPRPALGLELEDRPGPGLRASPSRVEVPALGAGRQVVARTRLRFPRRGWTQVRGVELGSRFPLGVFRALRAAPGAQEVLVHPRLGRPSPALLERLSGRGEGDARRRARVRGLEELAGVREWREGDDPRRLHPRSSARRGQAVVTEWQAEHGRELLLVLGPGSRGASAAFERAVSAAGSIWCALGRLRRPARLLIGTQAVGSAGGIPEPGPGLDRLAECEAPSTRSVAQGLARIARRSLPRSVLLVSAGAVEPPVAQAAAAAAAGGDLWVLDVRDAAFPSWIGGLG